MFRKDPMLPILVAAAIVAIVLVVREKRKEGFSDADGQAVRGYCRKLGYQPDRARRQAKEKYEDRGDAADIESWCNRGIGMHKARQSCRDGNSLTTTRQQFKNRSDMYSLDDAEIEWACKNGVKLRSKDKKKNNSVKEADCASGKYCSNAFLRMTRPCQKKDDAGYCCKVGDKGCKEITQALKDRSQNEWDKAPNRPGSANNPACKPTDAGLEGCTFYRRNLVDGKWKCWQGHSDTGLGKGGSTDPYFMMQCATTPDCKKKAVKFQKGDNSKTTICPGYRQKVHGA